MANENLTLMQLLNILARFAKPIDEIGRDEKWSLSCKLSQMPNILEIAKKSDLTDDTTVKKLLKDVLDYVPTNQATASTAKYSIKEFKDGFLYQEYEDTRYESDFNALLDQHGFESDKKARSLLANELDDKGWFKGSSRRLPLKLKEITLEMFKSSGLYENEKLKIGKNEFSDFLKFRGYNPYSNDRLSLEDMLEKEGWFKVVPQFAQPIRMTVPDPILPPLPEDFTLSDFHTHPIYAKFYKTVRKERFPSFMKEKGFTVDSPSFQLVSDELDAEDWFSSPFDFLDKYKLKEKNLTAPCSIETTGLTKLFPFTGREKVTADMFDNMSKHYDYYINNNNDPSAHPHKVMLRSGPGTGKTKLIQNWRLLLFNRIQHDATHPLHSLLLNSAISIYITFQSSTSYREEREKGKYFTLEASLVARSIYSLFEIRKTFDDILSYTFSNVTFRDLFAYVRKRMNIDPHRVILWAIGIDEVHHIKDDGGILSAMNEALNWHHNENKNFCAIAFAGITFDPNAEIKRRLNPIQGHEYFLLPFTKSEIGNLVDKLCLVDEFKTLVLYWKEKHKFNMILQQTEGLPRLIEIFLNHCRKQIYGKEPEKLDLQEAMKDSFSLVKSRYPYLENSNNDKVVRAAFDMLSESEKSNEEFFVWALRGWCVLKHKNGQYFVRIPLLFFFDDFLSEFSQNFIFLLKYSPDFRVPHRLKNWDEIQGKYALMEATRCDLLLDRFFHTKKSKETGVFELREIFKGAYGPIDVQKLKVLVTPKNTDKIGACWPMESCLMIRTETIYSNDDVEEIRLVSCYKNASIKSEEKHILILTRIEINRNEEAQTNLHELAKMVEETERTFYNRLDTLERSENLRSSEKELFMFLQSCKVVTVVLTNSKLVKPNGPLVTNENELNIDNPPIINENEKETSTQNVETKEKERDVDGSATQKRELKRKQKGKGKKTVAKKKTKAPSRDESDESSEEEDEGNEIDPNESETKETTEQFLTGKNYLVVSLNNIHDYFGPLYPHFHYGIFGTVYNEEDYLDLGNKEIVENKNEVEKPESSGK